MPTLQEVAAKAGFSTATVSKVLSNTPYFTEETRRKVLEAVEELGYVPNLAGRALSTGKTNIVGVIFPYIYDTVFTDPLVMDILQGIEKITRKQGYSILLSTPRISGDTVETDYLQLVRSGYLDGIIALDNVPTASVIAPAVNCNLPAVGVGSDSHSVYVRGNDYEGGYQSMSHLLELGHRRIGIIQTPTQLNRPVSQRVDGMRAAADKAHIDFEKLSFATGDFSTESGYRAAEDMLTHNPDITALICINDRMAIGAIQYAIQQGIGVPNQLSIVGYDNIPTTQLFSPTITTIHQHAPEMGRLAAEMLFDVLNGKTVQPVTLPTKLIVRQSSGPVATGS